MKEHQAAFLLMISGNVQEKLTRDKAVLSASWEYPQRQTSVLIEAQLMEANELPKAGLALRKRFSIYGIIRSIYYCPSGVESALRLINLGLNACTDGSR